MYLYIDLDLSKSCTQLVQNVNASSIALGKVTSEIVEQNTATKEESEHDYFRHVELSQNQSQVMNSRN